jgi:CheY-like chemotaxis protein/HPt (histidine-containing phosphotransfer) domain-containing protein
MVFRETASPLEALAWIAAGDAFDVAVLDMQMPELDGARLAAEIRKTRDARTLPLVLLASLGHRDIAQSTADFAALLTKPIKPSQLLDALVSVLLEPGSRPIQAVSAPADQLFDVTMGQRLPLRILLAEDNATNQKLAMQLLGRMGYAADLVADGREAVEAIESREYDVVLMDMQMPEMDGLEATRHIRLRHGQGRPPYIVAMTANAMQGDREMCLAAGMDDYVSKPIAITSLIDALTRGAAATLQHESGVVLDEATLARLRAMGGSDQQFFAELIGTFLDDAPQLLRQLRQALAAGDAQTVRLVAHGLKSNGAEFGAMAFSDLCKDLELMAKSGQLDGAAALLDRIEASYESVAAALRAERDR